MCRESGLSPLTQAGSDSDLSDDEPDIVDMEQCSFGSLGPEVVPKNGADIERVIHGTQNTHQSNDCGEDAGDVRSSGPPISQPYHSLGMTYKVKQAIIRARIKEPKQRSLGNIPADREEAQGMLSDSNWERVGRRRQRGRGVDIPVKHEDWC